MAPRTDGARARRYLGRSPRRRRCRRVENFCLWRPLAPRHQVVSSPAHLSLELRCALFRSRPSPARRAGGDGAVGRTGARLPRSSPPRARVCHSLSPRSALVPRDLGRVGLLQIPSAPPICRAAAHRRSRPTSTRWCGLRGAAHDVRQPAGRLPVIAPARRPGVRRSSALPDPARSELLRRLPTMPDAPSTSARPLFAPSLSPRPDDHAMS